MGLVQLSDLTVKRGHKEVLKNFSLEIKSGEVVALSGENGCGKSTVIEAAAGLLHLDEGTVTISKQIIKDKEGRRGRTNFGLCLQDDCIMGDELVGQRLLDVAGKNFDVSKLLESWNLNHRINDRVAMLSGGQRRKLAVISGILPALISDKPIAILLDEADSGLDRVAITNLSEIIRNLAASGHSILVSSHNENILNCADRIISFPFEAKTNNPKKGIPIHLKSKNNVKSNTGTTLDLRTMSSISNNCIVGLIVLGAMFAFLDPNSLKGRIEIAFLLAPSLAAGMCGDPILRLLQENRAYAWWNAKSAIPPNAIMNVSLICGGLTLLASASTGDFDWRIISVGAILGGFTAFVIAFIGHATLNLSRPNAVMIKLLTPILILPWALIVDALQQYV
ncbi:MAG: ABC transporter ATP-binding protein [Candidatus Poseidoniaceae archaeon]|jgi:energy-coupling factor transporter ATP-binding protein EcfA2|nr:ABC transporter ATP-binding protein [Candidatus Poseidoniaceae archaeon]